MSQFQPGLSDNVQQLFSSGTVILFIADATEDYPLRWVSRNSENILGFAPDYFLENKNGWSSRIHPDDERAVADEFQRVVGQGGEAINEYRFKKADGQYIWLRDEIKLVDDEQHDHPLIYGSSIDITNRKRAEIALSNSKEEELKEEVGKRKEAEKQLQKRLEYEKAISKCSSLLLDTNSDEALEKSLEILREVSEADRAYLYKNREINGKLYFESDVEVKREGTPSPMESSEKVFQYSNVPWWHKKLSSGEIIHEQIDNIPEPEKSILEKQKTKSLMVIPICSDEEWFGYVGFADTEKKRNWSQNEISLLNTASDVIAAFHKRRNIEQSLLQQRNYTETILDSLPSIYILMDEDYEFVQWNENAVKYTGYSSEELRTKNAFDLIVPEDHEDLRKATQDLQDQNGEGVELKLHTKEGEKIPYFWRGYFINLGGEDFFLCVGLDISQHKEVEKELLHEKRFNEALIESLPSIFYMIDKDGRYRRWNQNFVDELGYSNDDISEMKTPDVFTDEEFQRVYQAIQEVYEEGEAEIEANVLTKDGEQIPYYLTGKLFERDEEQYLVGVGYDISEQIEARERLQKSEELFRNLFLKAPAAIVMVNPENQIMDVNESFENLFGYTKDEVLGQDVDQLIVPEDEQGEVPRMPAEHYSADDFYKEARRVTKDGSRIDVFVAAIPVYVEGEPLAGFGMYIDITEQKEYEEKIYSSLKEKNVLLQEIHHRVKNNLAVVSGLLQLQMYETDDPVIRDTLKESESRIQTMALIHEKLYNSENLSRISTQSYINDLVATIQSTVDIPKDIAVETDIADIELNINNAVPFALLVNEVVTNSFKHAFTEQEEGRILIDISLQDDILHAKIKDNGKGLPGDFSPSTKDSLGMNLIDNFAKQLDANLEMGSNNGTYVSLSFNVGDIKGSSSGLTEF